MGREGERASQNNHYKGSLWKNNKVLPEEETRGKTVIRVHQSIPAVAMPNPPGHPHLLLPFKLFGNIYFFFIKKWRIPEGGDEYLSQCVKRQVTLTQLWTLFNVTLYMCPRQPFTSLSC